MDDAPDNLILARAAVDRAKEQHGLTPEVLALENILHHLERQQATTISERSIDGLSFRRLETLRAEGAALTEPRPAPEACIHRWSVMMAIREGIELRCCHCLGTMLVDWAELRVL